MKQWRIDCETDLLPVRTVEMEVWIDSEGRAYYATDFGRSGPNWGYDPYLRETEEAALRQMVLLLDVQIERRTALREKIAAKLAARQPAQPEAPVAP